MNGPNSIDRSTSIESAQSVAAAEEARQKNSRAEYKGRDIRFSQSESTEESARHLLETQQAKSSTPTDRLEQVNQPQPFTALDRRKTTKELAELKGHYLLALAEQQKDPEDDPSYQSFATALNQLAGRSDNNCISQKEAKTLLEALEQVNQVLPEGNLKNIVLEHVKSIRGILVSHFNRSDTVQVLAQLKSNLLNQLVATDKDPEQHTIYKLLSRVASQVDQNSKPETLLQSEVETLYLLFHQAGKELNKGPLQQLCKQLSQQLKVQILYQAREQLKQQALAQLKSLDKPGSSQTITFNLALSVGFGTLGVDILSAKIDFSLELDLSTFNDASVGESNTKSLSLGLNAGLNGQIPNVDAGLKASAKGSFTRLLNYDSLEHFLDNRIDSLFGALSVAAAGSTISHLSGWKKNYSFNKLLKQVRYSHDMLDRLWLKNNLAAENKPGTELFKPEINAVTPPTEIHLHQGKLNLGAALKFKQPLPSIAQIGVNINHSHSVKKGATIQERSLLDEIKMNGLSSSHKKQSLLGDQKHIINPYNSTAPKQPGGEWPWLTESQRQRVTDELGRHIANINSYTEIIAFIDGSIGTLEDQQSARELLMAAPEKYSKSARAAYVIYLFEELEKSIKSAAAPIDDSEAALPEPCDWAALEQLRGEFIQLVDNHHALASAPGGIFGKSKAYKAAHKAIMGQQASRTPANWPPGVYTPCWAGYTRALFETLEKTLPQPGQTEVVKPSSELLWQEIKQLETEFEHYSKLVSFIDDPRNQRKLKNQARKVKASFEGSRGSRGRASYTQAVMITYAQLLKAYKQSHYQETQQSLLRLEQQHYKTSSEEHTRITANLDMLAALARNPEKSFSDFQKAVAELKTDKPKATQQLLDQARLEQDKIDGLRDTQLQKIEIMLKEPQFAISQKGMKKLQVSSKQPFTNFSESLSFAFSLPFSGFSLGGSFSCSHTTKYKPSSPKPSLESADLTLTLNNGSILARVIDAIRKCKGQIKELLNDDQLNIDVIVESLAAAGIEQFSADAKVNFHFQKVNGKNKLQFVRVISDLSIDASTPNIAVPTPAGVEVGLSGGITLNKNNVIGEYLSPNTLSYLSPLYKNLTTTGQQARWQRMVTFHQKSITQLLHNLYDPESAVRTELNEQVQTLQMQLSDHNQSDHVKLLDTYTHLMTMLEQHHTTPSPATFRQALGSLEKWLDLYSSLKESKAEIRTLWVEPSATAHETASVDIDDE